MKCSKCGKTMKPLKGVHHKMKFYRCENCRNFVKKPAKYSRNKTKLDRACKLMDRHYPFEG